MRTSAQTLLALTVLTFQTSLPLAAGEKHATHAIEKVSETYRKAVLAGDAAAVTATYDPGAIEMPPCRPPIKGRTAIEQYYRELFNQPTRITNFAFAKTETATAGNIGYMTGAYKRTLVSQSGDRLEDSGSFVVILKRASGIWKSIYVIYNSEHPTASTNNVTQVIGSPFPALMNYYSAVASEWLFRFGSLFLGCICFGLIVSGVRSFLRRGRSGRQHLGSETALGDPTSSTEMSSHCRGCETSGYSNLANQVRFASNSGLTIVPCQAPVRLSISKPTTFSSLHHRMVSSQS